MHSTFLKSILQLLLLQELLVGGAFAKNGHEKQGVGHRNNLYKARLSEVSERIKRAQANAHALPKKHNKRAASVTYSATSTSSAAVTAASAAVYVGRQNDTSACTNQATSDGCTDPVYTIGSDGSVNLSNGGTLPASGHINFQYIPYSQYTGSGSYRSKPSTWSPVGCGMNFDPNNNQPGGAYIGQGSFPFSAACTLPAEGYCIIWVQYSNANQHYGEGGQGPVCYPGTSSGSAARSTSSSSSSTSSSSTSRSTSSSSASTSQASSTRSTSTSSSASSSSSSSSSSSKPSSSSTSTSSSASSTATGTGTGKLYDQCGGIGWTGTQGCVSGLTCVKSSDWYSQCQAPACGNSYYSQCGGQGYSGATCCPAPYTCKVVNAWYSQCQP
ncbi:carbohydrate-binding module family 1 protein [Cystobasidium minutum MCA 4210]|uniref:carbohydrate-binding module family 1 protein n=1 Tax=Cystobasidium minutum MCA 4210 TaxID=1397322 RepID=UPI0034CE09E4|eukprot:jgi/Rhomi1/188759/estExt_fgenesh1_pg.C_3_t10156